MVGGQNGYSTGQREKKEKAPRWVAKGLLEVNKGFIIT
jgi:hypothetical protein